MKNMSAKTGRSISLFKFIVMLLLVLGLSGFNVLFSIQSVALDLDFYVSKWTELGVPKSVGITMEDLEHVGEHLLLYFTGDAPSPQLTVTINGTPTLMFEEHEISHLEDVRMLFQSGLLAKHICEGLIAIGIILSAVINKCQDAVASIAKSLKLSAVILCAVVLIVTLAAILDFTSWWTSFHLITFTNDLWILDPEVDRLIQIFPEGFFYSAVTKICVTSLVIAGVYFILSLLINYLSSNYRKKHL